MHRESATSRTEAANSFVRMTLSERCQHWVLILSFVLLVFTGLPLIMYEWKPIQLLFLLHFDFHLRGVLHRIAAVLLIALCFWHIGYVIFAPRGREIFKALLFKKKDLTDAIEILMHNLGIASWLNRKGVLRHFFRRHPYWLFERAPRYDRYNFIEKFEYFAVVWGSFVMILTGFFMWQVELAMNLFPRHVFEVFVSIHSYEALLAFLSIIIWHMYNVHFAPHVFPMSRVWLTGRISREQLEHEHPSEYERIMTESRKKKS